MAPGNLSLGFPESSGIAPLLERLQQLAADPDSPIRAVHHKAALTKLYYLLGLGLPSAEVRARTQANLRGELTPA